VVRRRLPPFAELDGKLEEAQRTGRNAVEVDFSCEPQGR
jgi:hypothetical protein